LADHGPGGYVLSADGATLARDHPGSVARIVAKEWFFYQAWAGLADSVRDGHARIPPWRQRLAADPGRSLDFLRALDDLAARFGASCPPWPGWTGPAGCSRWAAGPAPMPPPSPGAVPGLEATVLDLPAVEPVVAERHPDLGFVAGDLDRPRFGRPAVATAAGLLTGGGTLLVYEWVPGQGGDGPAMVALFDLMMLVENEGGAAWPAATLTGWRPASPGSSCAVAPARSPCSAAPPPDPPIHRGPRHEAPDP
jgi:hypothetical protein